MIRLRVFARVTWRVVMESHDAKRKLVPTTWNKFNSARGDRGRE